MLVDGRRVIEARPGSDLLLGRDDDSDVRLDHPLVSRRHARLVHDQVWILEDLSSANGTWMNGQTIDRVSLLTSHEARFGDADEGPLVRFEIVDDARDVPVAASDTVVIGRAASCGLRLEDPMVSTQHARLERRGPTLWITDLGSVNQTIVNGEAIERRELREGDELLIGNTHLLVRDDALVPAETGGLAVSHAVLSVTGAGRIVNDVSFTVDRPSVVAVIGPSGAGKSSLLRLVTGQLRPTSGTVDFRGASMASQRQAFRGDIGVVPQHTIAHGALTARHALDYTARLRLASDVSDADRRRHVAAVLEQLGLGGTTGDTRIDKLSGGQQRRVSIAMELLTDPTMLILDEPTSGLDPSLVLQIMQLLRGFADAGKQVLVVTHDLEHLDLVDQVIVLRAGGTVAYDGPPEGIFGHFGRSTWAQVFADLATPHPPQESRTPPGTARATASIDVPDPTVDAQQIVAKARVVAERQLRIMAADRLYVFLMAGMPVVLAMLALAVPGGGGLGLEGTRANEPNLILAILVIGAAFLGLATAIRELVGERPIYAHERDAGLPPLAYLAAKTVVLAALAIAQSVILVAIVLIIDPDPVESIFPLLPPAMEILLAVAATAVCCVMLGLAVSARVASTEQATPPLVLLVMTQLALCGALFPIRGIHLVLPACLAPARWGFAAAAATTDLNAPMLDPSDADSLWDHEFFPWFGSLLMLAILSAGFWYVAYRGIRRRLTIR